LVFGRGLALARSSEDVEQVGQIAGPGIELNLARKQVHVTEDAVNHVEEPLAALDDALDVEGLPLVERAGALQFGKLRPQVGGAGGGVASASTSRQARTRTGVERRG
jgi:hypothetical protein